MEMTVARLKRILDGVTEIIDACDMPEERSCVRTDGDCIDIFASNEKQVVLFFVRVQDIKRVIKRDTENKEKESHE